MSQPYIVTFTDEARAAAGESLAAVEEAARVDLDDLGITDITKLLFHSFSLTDGGQEYICYPLVDGTLEINVVARHESAGRIEEKSPWLAESFGLSGEVVFPVAATKK